MNSARVTVFCSVALVTIAALGGFVWLLVSSPVQVEERVPLKTDHEIAGGAQAVKIEGVFARSNGTPSTVIKASWPRFRGVDFDNVLKDSVPLLDSWPEGGPEVVWRVALGEGYAGPVVINGCVYILDYDEKKYSDALRCLSMDDGREIWRRSYKVQVKRNHGMSRTTPAVTDKYVVTIGPRCQVMCCDTGTGAFKWGVDLAKDYGTEVPLWYTGQCPLIDGNVAVVAPAGKCLMMGIDCETGKVVWETPNPDKFKMSHSSIMLMTVAGRRMYVYAAAGGIAGVSAEEKDRGALLWQSREWNHAVVAPAPVKVDDSRIFMTSGYGVGSMMFSVVRKDGQFEAATLYKLERKVFACEQHSPVVYNGKLYSVLPADAEIMRKQFVCLDPDGKQVWASGPEHRFGIGPFMVADGKFFIMNDDGQLTMVRATEKGYEQLAQAQVLNGRDSWGPLAIVDGRMLVRDLSEMKCLDLRKK